MVDLFQIFTTFVEYNFELLFIGFALGLASFFSVRLSDLGLMSGFLIGMAALYFGSYVLAVVGVLFVLIGFALKYLKM